MRRGPLLLSPCALLAAAGLALAQAPGPTPRSSSATSRARPGIAFQHQAAPEKKYIMESMSGGVALLDYDNDGLLDIYLTNSLTVDTPERPEGGAQRALPQPRRHAASRT